VWSGS